MPTVQRPKVEEFTVNQIRPVEVERRLNSDGDGWEYRARRRSTPRWSFWYRRGQIEENWDIILPPDPEIPEPRVTMPVEVYDKDGAITISDEEVWIHAYDLRVGDELRVGPNNWSAITSVSGIGSSAPIRYRIADYGATRRIAPWLMVTIKIVE